MRVTLQVSSRNCQHTQGHLVKLCTLQQDFSSQESMWAVNPAQASSLRTLVCLRSQNKYHRLGGSQQTFIISQFWRLEVLDQRVCGAFLLMPLSLACRGPSSSLCLHMVCVALCPDASSYKNTSHIRLGPGHVTSLNGHLLFKGPVLKYRCSSVYDGATSQ